jgi:(p)ppGpp synthase/HD superfamily hydrolase
MHNYAQNNLQLYNELLQQSYPIEDLVRIRATYELATKLMPGHIRPNGKAMEAHLAGTASILARHQAPLNLVLVGLIHAAYSVGDFGGLTKPGANARRRVLVPVIGEEAENLLASYSNLSWTSPAILEYAQNLEKRTPLEKETIIIRLANELEDNLDLGVLFCVNREARRNYMKNYGPALVGMAEQLGYHALGRELAESHHTVINFPDMESLPIASDSPRETVVPPLSYRPRVLPAVSRSTAHLTCRVTGKIGRILKGTVG